MDFMLNFGMFWRTKEKEMTNSNFTCTCKGFYIHPNCPQHGNHPVINLDQEFWNQIKQAATESTWIPKEYYTNDWVADVCKFLREGNN